jgi:hypothetical protein
MAIAQSVVIALDIMYGNQAPSASDLEWWASPAAADITYNQAVVLFATSAAAQANYPYLAAPNVASPQQYVEQIFQNNYGIPASAIDPVELDYWVSWLSLPDDNGIPNYLELPSVINQYSPPARQAALVNRANVALDFTQKMLAAGNSTFTPAQSGNSWAIINTVTADPATVVAAKAATDQFIANGGGQTGNTFTFTTAIDNLIGGATNDSFIGDNGTPTAITVQAADQVNGGGGTDTFKYFAPNVALPSLVDVENVQLLSANASVDGIDFSPLAGKGIQQVTFVGSAPDLVTVKGLNGIAFGVENVTAGTPNLTGDFGTATAATFIVTSSQVGDITLNGANLKSLDVQSEGKSNKLNDLVAVGGVLASINVVGTGGLTVTNSLDNSVKTIDASKNTGGVNLIAGNSDLTFTGGSGNDTLNFAALQFTSKDVLDGGAGKDTLVLGDVLIDGNAALVGAINSVKNFETLGFSGGGATVDASAITAFTDYRLQGVAGNFSIQNASSTNTLTIAVDNAGFTTNIANKLGQDTANLTLEGSGVGTGGLTLTGLTTLNLASTKGNSTATVANSINNFVANPDNLKILVTGDQALTVAAPNATLTGVTVDATKFTAKLNFTGTGKVDSLTGGTGADTLTGGLGADALTGGVGADTFSYNPGGAADSNAGTLTGVVTFDTISDFDVAADKLSSALFVPANLTAQGTVQAAVNVSGATTLSTAIGVAAAAIGASKYGAFQIAGSTYVLANDAVVGTVGAGDLLVQLTGNLTLTATNYTV